MVGKLEKALVLFVAAEPQGVGSANIAAEFRDIQDEVERNGQAGRLEFRTLWAARREHITRAMSDDEPVIVHFSGHGTPDGGIVIEGPDGSAKEIDRNAMGSLFRTYKKRVTIVVLNSCYSDKLAEEIVQSVDAVVGMREEIGIEAAVHFAVGLYRGLARRNCLQRCFQMALTELDMEMIPERHIPVLHTRPGVDAYEVFAFDALDPEPLPSPPTVAPVAPGVIAPGRPDPGLVLGALAGAAATRCLDIMVQNHKGAAPPDGPSLEDARYRVDAGMQRDDSGQLIALHGIPMRQYAEAEPWELAIELGNGHSVLLGIERHGTWRQHPIFVDLGATDPVLLARVEPSDSGPRLVVVVAPGSAEGSADYALESFVEAWRETPFFMVATREPPEVDLGVTRESHFQGSHRASDSVERALRHELGEMASEAFEEITLTDAGAPEAGAGDATRALDSSYPEPRRHAPSPFAEGSRELSVTSCDFAAPVDTEEDSLDGDIVDSGDDGWCDVG